ncbi:MAG: 1-deoxyxylulose-5-phosphate synthase [Blastocatellia bacterium]
MDKLSRRNFIALTATGTLGAGVLAGRGLRADAPGEAVSFVVDPTIKNPTDKVRLGKTDLKISLVGIGTGTNGWNRQSNQTRLGQESFTRLIRHAHDSGITFFDLADQYGSNPYFSRAMQGVARDRYVIQTKTNSRDPQAARQDIDRFLRELGTDHIDVLIVHCVTEADWTTRYRGVMDVMEEAKQKGKIRAHGVTCHSYEALQAAAASAWVDTNQVRWNARAAHADADVDTLRKLFAGMRGKGQGMVGMKVVGQGDIVRGADASSPASCFRFQIESGVVDAFVVGVEKLEHIDEMLRGTQVALAELGYRTVVPA